MWSMESLTVSTDIPELRMSQRTGGEHVVRSHDFRVGAVKSGEWLVLDSLISTWMWRQRMSD